MGYVKTAEYWLFSPWSLVRNFLVKRRQTRAETRFLIVFRFLPWSSL